MDSTAVQDQIDQLLDFFPEEKKAFIKRLLKELENNSPDNYKKVIALTKQSAKIQAINEFICENPEEWFSSTLAKLEKAIQPLLPSKELEDLDSDLYKKYKDIISSLIAPYLFTEELIGFVKSDFNSWFSLSTDQMEIAPSAISSVKLNSSQQIDADDLMIAIQNLAISKWIRSNQSTWSSFHSEKKLAFINAFQNDEIVSLLKKNTQYFDEFNATQIKLTTQAAVSNDKLKVLLNDKARLWRELDEGKMHNTLEAFKNKELSNWIDHFTNFWTDFSEQKMELTILGFNEKNSQLSDWINNYPAFWSHFNDQQAALTRDALQIEKLAKNINKNPAVWTSYSVGRMQQEIDKFNKRNNDEKKSVITAECNPVPDGQPPIKAYKSWTSYFCFPCNNSKAVGKSVVKTAHESQRNTRENKVIIA